MSSSVEETPSPALTLAGGSLPRGPLSKQQKQCQGKLEKPGLANPKGNREQIFSVGGPWRENQTESWASKVMSRGFDPHLKGSCVDNPSLNGGAFQKSLTLVDGIGGSNRVHKTFAPQSISSDYPFPENVEKPNRHP
jgi:hypothetical protein